VGADPARVRFSWPGEARAATPDEDAALAEPVHQPLQSVREDTSSDLAQLRGSIDELRGEVASLRLAVLEGPTLGRVTADVAALRADMADVIGRLAGGKSTGSGASLASLAPLVEEVAALRGDLTSLVPVADELSRLREEVAGLRRRIPLRVPEASQAPFPPAEPVQSRWKR
jgi:hypothetical protein